MKSKMARRLVTCVTLGAFICGSGLAQAHNPSVHQKIVNLAWQSMRAANRADLISKIAWTDPANPPSAAPRLDRPGDCSLSPSDSRNLCGATVTNAQWTSFLDEIRRARQQLSGVHTELPFTPSGASGCSTYNPNVSSGSFPHPPSTDHLGNVDLDDTTTDDKKREHRCDFAGTPRNGIFADFSVPDDGQGNQGLIMGWHALHRDYDQSDTSVDLSLPVVAQVVAEAAHTYELVLGAVLVPFVCAWSLISGENCLDESFRLADDLNPIDYLKGIVPGFRIDEASEEGRSLWHFINVQAGVANEYDDVQGMLYEEAGPNRVPAGTDQAIILLGDLAVLTLDASKSAGTERYELTSDETSTNPSSDRGEVRWQMETLGHITMSPIDNFAYYGDMGRPNGHPGAPNRGEPSQMGWPLHAIGDVSVPFHVVGTTGWGHRPYEDVNAQEWSNLMFETCRSGDACGSNDLLKLRQLQQTHRILQRAYRWREYLRAKNDVRELVTQLARETLTVAGPADSGSVWCDSCSAGWASQNKEGIKADTIEAFTVPIDKEAADDFEGYYRGTIASFQTTEGRAKYDTRIWKPMRDLMERGVAATLGYLVFRGATSGNCRVVGQTCSTVAGTARCCGGSCGTAAGAAVCCRDGAESCSSDSECCSGSCVNEACSSKLGEACVGTACTAGQCTNGVCCHPGVAACARNSDCCSGICSAGQCTAATCSTVPCPSGKSCVNDKCCGQGGTSCGSAGDCCSGACGPGGQCQRNPGESCAADSDCNASLCLGATCCRRSAGGCTTDAECCSGNCDNGACVGKTDGSVCNSYAECASNRCVGTTCQAQVK